MPRAHRTTLSAFTPLLGVLFPVTSMFCIPHEFGVLLALVEFVFTPKGARADDGSAFTAGQTNQVNITLTEAETEAVALV